MENLFRLMLVRPAVGQDPESPSIDLTQESTYQTALREVVEQGGGREGAEAVTTVYVNGPAYLSDPADNPLADQLAALAQRLDKIEAEEESCSDLAQIICEIFGASPDEVIATEAFGATLERLRDSLMAIKLLQQEHARPIEELTRQLRTMEVVGKAAADECFPETCDQLHRWRRRSLRLPLALGLGSRLSTREAEKQLREQRQAAVEERREQVTGLLDRHGRLRAALDELGALESHHFRVSALVDSEAVLPPATLRLESALASESTYVHNLRARNLHKTEPDGPIGEAVVAAEGAATADGTATVTGPPTTNGTSGTNGSLADEPEPSVQLAAALLGSRPAVLPGRATFTAPDLSETGFGLKSTAVQALSEPTRALLAERNVDLTAAPLDRVTERLSLELASTVGELEQLAGHPVKRSFVRIGDALVSVATPLTTGWGIIGTGGVLPFPLFELDGRIPHTKGEVAPAGVADLLVVRQQLTGYEGADVAHIENVLRGERKLREHSRRQETEVITVSETEVTTSDERELETTDRFEMTREASETIKEDVALKAGLNITGKYGPVVEFSASAEGSFQRSKEEATKSATTFSQDVTERSSRKIAERVLERTTRRTTTETIEKNTHELNNVGSAEHVAGVYQWVNKVYRAQMFNYGLRAMFDFMVPEPAAFLVAAMQQARSAAIELQQPPAFTLTPSQITESNYQYWVKQCGATDVVPPPELYRTKSADFKAGGGDKAANYNHSGQIAIDDGYRAVYGSVGVVRNVWSNDHSVDVVLGGRTQRMGDGNWRWFTTLDDERDSIPFAIDSFHCSQVAVAIEVKCQRTDRALEKWRLETHAKLTTAHAARVADYEEKLAALKMQAGIEIRGTNPASNLVTIRNELKKNAISILTDQHFDLFNSIDASPTSGLPQMDVLEAAGEGPYVRFFEQAFEWEHMTWVTYPYFWGRKDQWDERIAYTDPDPVFNEFLQAGFCRVSVPARPGFEGAIDHFLTFGETWNGGPLPSISSPLYLPIADEIAERLDRPGQEVPQGDHWTVRVPTTLVHLRADDQLPHWERNEDGDWVEA